MSTSAAATPQRDSYDVVVVGAGIGGLSAGSLLAKAGKTVLVLEQGEKWGGYVQSFTSGPYTFDPAVHAFPMGHDGALPDALLQYLGVREQYRMLQGDMMYTAVFPEDVVVHAPPGLDECIEAHARVFPDEAERIDAFFRCCRTVHHQAHVLPPQIGLAGLDEAARLYPELIKYLRSTVADVLDEYLTDPRAKAACAALWPYIGCPPSRLSFVTFATTISVYLDGASYCEGSFQRLADAFAAAVSLHGGEIVTGQTVTSITVSDGRADGVVLADGGRIAAETVVSNADARRTFDELVGEEHLPARFVRRLRSMTPSYSAFIVFAGSTLDVGALGYAHEIFNPVGFDHEASDAEIQAGRPGGMWASIPTMIDPTLAPEGEHAITLTSLARYDIGRPWPDAADAFREQLLDSFERILPGLRDSITHMQTATPLTMERFCLNSGGAAYAWENTPDQTGGRRSPHVTPVEGLYLAGHWTQPGSGSLRCIVSGLHTAQLVLHATGSALLDFEHADMPPST